MYQRMPLHIPPPAIFWKKKRLRIRLLTEKEKNYVSWKKGVSGVLFSDPKKSKKKINL
jgi:hypothetical protein|tara:strand:+ start:243 stop:416 length:174 start_codon:yes stop_codon:yes gene_type:complete